MKLAIAILVLGGILSTTLLYRDNQRLRKENIELRALLKWHQSQVICGSVSTFTTGNESQSLMAEVIGAGGGSSYAQPKKEHK